MNNDSQLKQLIIDELKEVKADVKIIKEEMITLKVKVTAITAFISSILTIIGNKFFGS